MSNRPAGSRFLQVGPDRLPGWVTRYVHARGGEVRCIRTGSGLELLGADGSTATLALLDPSGWSADARGGADLDAEVGALAAAAALATTLLVTLVRRGGWTVGVVREGVVLAGSTGRRYVQGTTAAGGWSQQRFARRRTGQSAKLADDATSAVGRVLAQVPEQPGAVVWGGDRALADSVLLGTSVAGARRLGPLQVGEPRRVDLEAAAQRVLEIRITVHDAPA